MTTVIDMRKTAMGLSELVSKVAPDSEIIIADGDEPRVRVTSIPVVSETKQRIAGLNRGSVWIADDFDDPLPEEFWLGADEAAS